MMTAHLLPSLIALIAISSFSTNVAAQGNGLPISDHNAHVKACSGSPSTGELLERTLRQTGKDAPPIILAKVKNPLGEEAGANEPLKTAAGSTITITLTRPDHVDEKVWQSSRTSAIGAAETDRKKDQSTVPVDQKPVGAYITDRAPGKLVFEKIVTPDNPIFYWRERWRIVIAVCDQDDKFLGYAVATVLLTPPPFAGAISLLALLVFWLMFAVAAWQLNAQKLQERWKKEHDAGKDPTPARSIRDLSSRSTIDRLAWKLVRAASPLFISQDGLGYGSLSRLQTLLFTSVLFVVLCYIFVHTGVIASISNQLLILLGIMVASGTLGRITSDWSGISAANRRFLLGEEILAVGRCKPRLADIFETQGEIDVGKVQALLFTVLVIFGIALKGLDLAGFGTFELPQQIAYLLGISQGTYLIGKVIPVDTRKRLDQDLSQLQTSANFFSKEPKNSEAESNFNQAVITASSTLSEIYLDRFNLIKFNEYVKRVQQKAISDRGAMA